MNEKVRVSFRIKKLDHLLEGLYIGDKLVRPDDAAAWPRFFGCHST
jgi:hypothetical protein